MCPGSDQALINKRCLSAIKFLVKTSYNNASKQGPTRNLKATVVYFVSGGAVRSWTELSFVRNFRSEIGDFELVRVVGIRSFGRIRKRSILHPMLEIERSRKIPLLLVSLSMYLSREPLVFNRQCPIVTHIIWHMVKMFSMIVPLPYLPIAIQEISLWDIQLSPDFTMANRLL